MIIIDGYTAENIKNGHGHGHGMPAERYYADESGHSYFVQVVELTDECIERIADAVVRKMNEPKEERICGNCKHGHGDGLQSYVYCKGKSAMVWEYNKGCERWEKE